MMQLANARPFPFLLSVKRNGANSSDELLRAQGFAGVRFDFDRTFDFRGRGVRRFVTLQAFAGFDLGLDSSRGIDRS